MDPLTILSLGFGAMQLLGDKQSAEGSASALDASAGLYDIQAGAIIANAEYAVRRAEESGRRDTGTYVARFAKAGVTFEGTPAISIAETERSIRLDVLATRLDAAAKANELGFAGMNARISASMTRMKAANDFSTGLLKLGASAAISNMGKNPTTTTTKKSMTTPEVIGMKTGTYDGGMRGFRRRTGLMTGFSF